MTIEGMPSTEWQTFILGPYDGDPHRWTFPCLPQVRTGHTKVFAPRATLGPPDPNVDDTLSTLNYMDLTGGQGISRINVSTDLSMFWWSNADTRWADGWTPGPEVFGGTEPEDLTTDAAKIRPSDGVGPCTPIGRIGTSMYALWGSRIHRWDPDLQTWSTQMGTVGGMPEGSYPVLFNDMAFFPLGDAGYAYVTEVLGVAPAPPTLTIVPVTGTARPTEPRPVPPPDPPPTNAPKVLLFGVHEQLLWAITTKTDGYALCSATTGLTGNAWDWPHSDANKVYVKVNQSVVPKVLVTWIRPDGDTALWCVTNRGALIFDDSKVAWTETNLWNVPPHPNFGRAAIPWRPGEALWISSGGGDAFQYTASNVAQPAQGPGGRRDGLPYDKRGDIVSFASDLANLYALMQTDVIIEQTSMVEDEPADPLSLPSTFRNTSLIANTGKGWHPLWETQTAVGAPTRVVVSDALNKLNGVDYRVFWGVGDYCYSMAARLTTYSSRQGRQQGKTRFARKSTIEFGEFNAGSIGNKKLFSHAAILMDVATDVEYVEYEYQTDQHDYRDWDGTGAMVIPPGQTEPVFDTTAVARTAGVHRSRTVFPFGMSGSGTWSAGIANYWIKQKLTLWGPGGLSGPSVQALTLAYLPLPQDSAHQVYTIPLPVDVDERTGKTREQIYQDLKDHLVSEEMLFLQFQNRTYRAYVAGLSVAEIAGQDFVGAITLNVIQIPTGLLTLIGEAA